jgi:hypothetical protein
MAEAARPRMPLKSQTLASRMAQEVEVDEEGWEGQEGDEIFDTALHLASHAQRLRNVEDRVDHIAQLAQSLRGQQVKTRARIHTIIGLCGGGFIACLLFAAFIPEIRHLQATRTTYVPVPVYANNSMPTAFAPAAPPAPVMPMPVAPPAPPPPPAPVLTPFQKKIQSKLAARNVALPSSWQNLFDREAAGDRKAKLLVAAKFLKGEDVPRDQTFAVELIRQSAESGEKEAMMWLAYAYQGGHLGKVDLQSAVRWFEAAGKAGVTSAYAELGRIYETGVDGAPDLETSLGWYQQGAKNGDVKAAEAINRINAKIQGVNTPAAAPMPAPAPAAPVPAPAPQPQAQTQTSAPDTDYPLASAGAVQIAPVKRRAQSASVQTFPVQTAETASPIERERPVERERIVERERPAERQVERERVAERSAERERPERTLRASAPLSQTGNVPNAATVTATPVAASVPVPAALSNMSAEDAASHVRAVQRGLRALGYKVDHVDGTYGPSTANAIRAYQRNKMMYPDGEPSPELIEALMKDIRFGE